MVVPITREFLRQFYAKFPLEPVPSHELEVLTDAVGQFTSLLLSTGGQTTVAVTDSFRLVTPTRIDDCFWRNRMVCEEIAVSLQCLEASFVQSAQGNDSSLAAKCRVKALDGELLIRTVQEENTASVKKQMKRFLPQDLRGIMLEKAQASKEARYKKQVEDLVKAGGSVRSKYELYLTQQWERRQSLVQFGEASGVYKAVVKYLAGIPQVLLDFAKEINAKLGPMEEQRIKYGPDLYAITTLGISVDVCLAAWVDVCRQQQQGPKQVQHQQPGEMMAALSGSGSGGGADGVTALCDGALERVIKPALEFYLQHMTRIIRFIGDVFQVSPFFIDQNQAAAAEAASSAADAGNTAATPGKDTACGAASLTSAVPESASAAYSMHSAASSSQVVTHIAQHTSRADYGSHAGGNGTLPAMDCDMGCLPHIATALGCTSAATAPLRPRATATTNRCDDYTAHQHLNNHPHHHHHQPDGHSPNGHSAAHVPGATACSSSLGMVATGGAAAGLTGGGAAAGVVRRVSYRTSHSGRQSDGYMSAEDSHPWEKGSSSAYGGGGVDGDSDDGFVSACFSGAGAVHGMLSGSLTGEEDPVSGGDGLGENDGCVPAGGAETAGCSGVVVGCKRGASPPGSVVAGGLLTAVDGDGSSGSTSGPQQQHHQKQHSARQQQAGLFGRCFGCTAPPAGTQPPPGQQAIGGASHAVSGKGGVPAQDVSGVIAGHPPRAARRFGRKKQVPQAEQHQQQQEDHVMRTIKEESVSVSVSQGGGL